MRSSLALLSVGLAVHLCDQGSFAAPPISRPAAKPLVTLSPEIEELEPSRDAAIVATSDERLNRSEIPNPPRTFFPSARRFLKTLRPGSWDDSENQSSLAVGDNASKPSIAGYEEPEQKFMMPLLQPPSQNRVAQNDSDQLNSHLPSQLIVPEPEPESASIEQYEMYEVTEPCDGSTASAPAATVVPSTMRIGGRFRIPLWFGNK
ncbi:hypothetical protein SH668x_002476 [Planctomicrobium sp. SH668]|uniref:hypothetical protein n=1 Tax=Planctomicrobium sp. SH668 TaxID=3448126 RepID=UPI003F5B9B6C